MKAMVLAAGEGRRLRPITNNIPKPMVPIAGKPILEHNVRWLKKHGIDDLIMNLHYHPDAIRQHFGDGGAFGVHIEYSFEPELLGTAGAIRAVANKLRAERFAVIYGDNLSTCDLGRLLDQHVAKQAFVTIAVFHRDDVTKSGMVVLDDADRVVAFVEKPPPERVVSNWVSAGIMIVEPGWLRLIPDQNVSDIGHDVLPSALEAGERVYAYRMTEGLWWADSLDDYYRLESLAAERKLTL